VPRRLASCDDVMLESVAINQNRVDLLHQYSMVVAANEDDWRSRELGPIHLIKLALKVNAFR
jgi:hypothetical protein